MYGSKGRLNPLGYIFVCLPMMQTAPGRVALFK